MKDRIILISLIANVVLIILGAITVAAYTDMKGRWKTEAANRKALLMANDTLNGRCRTLELSAAELHSVCDSFAVRITEMQKKLSIKDRKLEQAQYMASVASKRDTVVFSDTVVLHGVDIDTVIGDEWMRHKVHISYPSILAISSEVRSEKTVIMHTEKETVNPPKRFFLFRWFQRKHKVTVVEVNDANPYIKSVENRFIKIHR